MPWLRRRYYDLNRNPITCPRSAPCSTSCRARARCQGLAHRRSEDDEEEEEDLVAPELVTLEEADAEVEGDVVPDLEEDEEADIGDDAVDDVFIDVEDEESESVPGIVWKSMTIQTVKRLAGGG